MNALRIFVVLCFALSIKSFANDSLLLKINSEINLDSVYYNLEILTGKKAATIEGVNSQITSRQANSYGNHLSALYLNQKLIENGYETILNHYANYLKNDIEYPAENVVAISKGTEFPDKYVVICAHYDASATTDDSIAYGADDNASGVVTVLEAARVLNKYSHKYSIIYALFDHEENGPNGSHFFVDSMKKNESR